jgi:hypothetical protein
MIVSGDPRHDFVNRRAAVAEIMAVDALGLQGAEQALGDRAELNDYAFGRAANEIGEGRSISIR